MKKLLVALMLSLLATASYAQTSTITFNVEFNKMYAASGAFVPNLTDFTSSLSQPITATGTVVLTALASSTQITGGNTLNTITLNGSWSSAFTGNPPDTQQVWTYNNAVFGLDDGGSTGTGTAYFANDATAQAPQFIATGTAIDGLLSDLGPADLYGGTCPLFDFDFGSGPQGNCVSENPQITFEVGTPVNDTTSGVVALFPTLADAGWHPLISGSTTRETLNGGDDIPDLDHDNGLDGFYFEGGLDTSVPGAIVEGGIVRIVMTSATGNTMYVLEGTTSVVPVPAAAWLFGSALGMLAWVRRRIAK